MTQRCNKRVSFVRCVLPCGHGGDCTAVWPMEDRCFYQFSNEGEPIPRCRLKVGHEGRHEPDR